MNKSRRCFAPVLLFILTLLFPISVLPAAAPGDKGSRLDGLYRAGRARLVADLVIDASTLPEEAQVQSAVDIDTDQAGNLYVLDMKACDIKIFDGTGKFVKAIGGKGQGPGEFQVPYLMAVSGKTILVYDAMDRKLSRFDLDGKFIKNLTWPDMRESPKKIMGLPGGVFVLETEKDYRDTSDRPQVCRLVLLTEEPEPKEGIYERPVLHTKHRRSQQGGIDSIPQPFVPDIKWTATHQGLVLTGFSDKYAFDFLDPRKGRAGGFSWHSKPVQITAKDRKRWFNSIVMTDGNSGKSRSIGDNVPDFMSKNTVFPKFKPLFEWVICDPEGNILVCPVTEEGRTIIYDAFSPDGRFIARVDLSGGRKDLEVGLRQTSDGSLWSRTVDTDGNWLITRWRISE